MTHKIVILGKNIYGSFRIDDKQGRGSVVFSLDNVSNPDSIHKDHESISEGKIFQVSML